MVQNSWAVSALALGFVFGGPCAWAPVQSVDAGTLRIGTFTAAGVGLLENPNAEGMAKLKFYEDPIDGPSLRAYVHLYDFRPNTVYGVNIDTDQGGADFADVVTTNASGNGNVIVHFPVSAAPADAVILVYRDTINNDSWDLTEERAAGVPD